MSADLIRRRGTLKGEITRFNHFLGNGTPDPLDVQERLDRIRKNWEAFQSLQAEIEKGMDAKQLLEQDEERETFEAAHYAVVRAAKNHIPAVQANIVQHEQADGAIFIQSQQELQESLPRVTLPNFDGSCEAWLHFRDTYVALIHNRPRLTDIKKFTYLQGALKGDAAKVIQHLEITEANYTVAWDCIKDRYENVKLITQKHVQALFDLPAVTKGSSESLHKLTDETTSHLNALKSLGEPVDEWATLIIHLVTSKFDFFTKQEWEKVASKLEKPTFENLKVFARERCQILSALAPNKQAAGITTVSHNRDQNTRSSKSSLTTTQSYLTLAQTTCFLCKGQHTIYKCEKFLKLTIPMRIKELKTHSCCFNCLKGDHITKDCKSRGCRVCGKRHNTLIHAEDHKNDKSSQDDSESQTTTHVIAHGVHSMLPDVILSTAIIYVFDKMGYRHKCRALLDNASQSHIISNELCQRLNLQRTKTNIEITGIDMSTTKSLHRTKIQIHSRINDNKFDLDCVITDNVTKNLPLTAINRKNLKLPQHIQLADPAFDQPSKVDMLIGAGLFWDLIQTEAIKLQESNIHLRKTLLGWIVAGELRGGNTRNSIITCHLSINQKLSNQVEQFWKLENYGTPNAKHFSPEEIACEKDFAEKTIRKDGRFTVSLPFRESPGILGESKNSALKRVISLEKKLKQDPELYKAYTDFMLDYRAQNHMTILDQNEVAKIGHSIHYIPHHIVKKLDSLTTKIRVVFDGSAKTSTGISINDIQMIGPTLQEDLFTILVRFRLHSFVISADIKQMYRQILIDEKQRHLQCILWRPNPQSELVTCQLNTVTYGYAASSYLAIKCLQATANDIYNTNPEVSRIIKEDFYVDNLLTGTDDKTELIEIKRHLQETLDAAGLPLRQWASNQPEIFENEKTNTEATIICEDDEVKTLGLSWMPKIDQLQYNVKEDSKNANKRFHSKRSILSSVSQIFDPLGLVNPVTVKGKIIIQELWSMKLDWDDPIPDELAEDYSDYTNQLQELSLLRLPRHAIHHSSKFIDLHIFCDASEKAYGTCAYLVSENENGQRSSTLLCAKSRVAPLKKSTLARLELCAALLGSQLLSKLKSIIRCKIDKFHCWSDSTIALSWIAASPHKWQTFVANRTAAIQENSENANWKFIPGSENPADIISRGADPRDLTQCKLWWNGPAWLINQPRDWSPRQVIPSTNYNDLPEAKIICHQTVTQEVNGPIKKIISHFSTFRQVQNSVAWLIRYKNHLRKNLKTTSPILTINELRDATNILINHSQKNHFSEEIKQLKNNQQVKTTSKLSSLSPFLDQHDNIRVGGRLSCSSKHFDARHPLVLPQKDRLTELIIEEEHIRLLHAGCQAVLSSLRQRFWPISGRNVVRKIIHKCVKCFRAKPLSLTYKMSNLPRARIEQAHPFQTCGVDFAGPFQVKEGTTRNQKFVKTYICIFVCFVTKALHIELASNLTTEAFLNCLSRFIARRGKCQHIHSDNGTNFVGAARELKELQNLLNKMEQNAVIQTFLKKEMITWHFIPPHAPNFGGLWESAVKSTKFHMKRVFGESRLTYEEFYTVLTKIEACLNSRPISPISEDPNDLSALTPGHFLVGRPLTMLPERNWENTKENRLSRYQRTQAMFQHYWRRWHREYLHNLQQAYKWKNCKNPEIYVGWLVVIHDENLPPMRWPLGRIIAVHPGTDNVTRVVTLRTATGELKRPISKICLLPIEQETSSIPDLRNCSFVLISSI